jgi:hypothetical protein
MGRPSKHKTALKLAFALCIVAAILWGIVFSPRAYSTFTSPGGQYKVVVYAYGGPRFALPGQSGDGQGFARLYDANGQVLCEVAVPFVNGQDEHSIRWGFGSVSILSTDGFETCKMP